MQSWFYWKNNDLFLQIQLQPGAKTDEIVGPIGNNLKIRIKAPPIEGRANEYLLKYLAKCFEVRLDHVTLLRGPQSKIKLVKITAPKNVSLVDENNFS